MGCEKRPFVSPAVVDRALRRVAGEFATPRVHDLRHSWLGKPRCGLQLMDTRMGFPCPFWSVVIDCISLFASWTDTPTHPLSLQIYWVKHTKYHTQCNFGFLGKWGKCGKFYFNGIKFEKDNNCHEWFARLISRYVQMCFLARKIQNKMCLRNMNAPGSN